MNNTFSILVNSSDDYQDCWDAFFTLFSTYWPRCSAPIFLNTENLDWSHQGMEITCIRAQQLSCLNRRLTWSECLITALQRIETPLVLYFQEDYFIERPVNVDLIEEMAEYMLVNPAVKHIGLTHFGSRGPFRQTDDQRLWQISDNSPYRISTQVGLWRVETLLSYLRADENGWMFEICGTKRAQCQKECFLTVNRDMFNIKKTPIVQYTHTGIIKGRWHPDIHALFARHGISVDFEKRGVYRSRAWFIRKLETARTIISNPVALARAYIWRSCWWRHL